MNINTSSSNNFSVDTPDAHVLPNQPVLVASGDSADSTVVEMQAAEKEFDAYASQYEACLLYTSPSPRDATLSRMPSSA